MNGDHKLELNGTAEMSSAKIIHELERIFVADPLLFSLSRVDLAVDVFGYSVSWFQRNMTVNKRHAAEYGCFRKENYQVETLYYGKRVLSG